MDISHNRQLVGLGQKVLGLLPVQALMVAALSVSAQASDRMLTDADLADRTNTADWLAYGRTHYEQRFSPLADIHIDNVSKLKPEWYIDLPTEQMLVNTPLVIDGILYYNGTMNMVHAVDARTGKALWTYDPQVADAIRSKKQRRVFWKHSRGISAYGDKLFLVTWDGRIIGINRKTGKEVWSTRAFPVEFTLQLTMAPKAFNGLVLIGNGGTELGPTRGWVAAYDTETGEEAWRWYIVPGNPADGFEDESQAMAAKTWTGKWWEHGGGGNAWHGYTYDPELDTIYVGTGNGSPWNRKVRSPGGGDNLYLCSVVALDAKTGKYKWHVQTAPGDSWDYNSNMDIVLADLNIDGKDVKAIIHAPKNGFFYVIDRTNGRVLSAEKFADANWSTHFDLETQRHVIAENAYYEDGRQNIYPSAFGAHSWHAMSYNPELGLAFIPTNHVGNTFTDEGDETDPNWRGEDHKLGIAVGVVANRSPHETLGSLQAWDVVNNKRVWENNQEFAWGAGTLTTAGNLLFQGDPDGKFKAYDARNGKELWEFDAGLGISAPPITYKLDGKQMISLLVGPGGTWATNFLPLPEGGFETHGWKYGVHTRRLITFAIDGEAVVPEQPAPAFAQPVIDKAFEVDEENAAQGAGVYALNVCLACHGAGAVAGSAGPDLRESAFFLSGAGDALKSVVREGALVHRGMPAYPKITDDELDALRHYIRQQAHSTVASTEGH